MDCKFVIESRIDVNTLAYIVGFYEERGLLFTSKSALISSILEDFKSMMVTSRYSGSTANEAVNYLHAMGYNIIGKGRHKNVNKRSLLKSLQMPEELPSEHSISASPDKMKEAMNLLINNEDTE